MAVYKIGRAEGNDIVLGEKSVSRQHAVLEELGAGRFRIKDLGSSQGTQMLSGTEWVDVKEAEIRHDTKLRLGEYETTPMDLVRDQDKTQVQVKPATPAPPRPPAPRPATPRAAEARPAAPRPAPPRPAAPRPASPRPAAVAGAGISPQMKWWLIGGGAGFLVLVLIVVVVVLLTGGDEQRRAAPTTPAAPRTEAPPATPPATPPAPRAQPPATPPAQPPAQPPATDTGLQRFTQSCRTTWQGSEAVCQCATRAVQPVLQPGDYDNAIAVMDLLFTNKGEEAKQKVQQLATQDQAMAQRIVQAVQAIGTNCKNVQ